MLFWYLVLISLLLPPFRHVVFAFHKNAAMYIAIRSSDATLLKEAVQNATVEQLQDALLSMGSGGCNVAFYTLAKAELIIQKIDEPRF